MEGTVYMCLECEVKWGGIAVRRSMAQVLGCGVVTYPTYACPIASRCCVKGGCFSTGWPPSNCGSEIYGLHDVPKSRYLMTRPMGPRAVNDRMSRAAGSWVIANTAENA